MNNDDKKFISDLVQKSEVGIKEFVSDEIQKSEVGIKEFVSDEIQKSEVGIKEFVSDEIEKSEVGIKEFVSDEIQKSEVGIKEFVSDEIEKSETGLRREIKDLHWTVRENGLKIDLMHDHVETIVEGYDNIVNGLSEVKSSLVNSDIDLIPVIKDVIKGHSKKIIKLEKSIAH